MSKVATKNPTDWEAFNRQVSALTHPLLGIGAFLVLWIGSIYGFQSMLESHFGDWGGTFAAVAVSLIIQLFAMVFMAMSSKLIPAFFHRQEIKSNTYYKMETVSYVMAAICFAANIGIVWVDFSANHEANEKIVNQITEKPQEKAANTATADRALASAEKAYEAAKTRYETRKAAHNAKVEAKTASRRAALNSRLRQLNGRTWASTVNERNSINRELAGLDAKAKAEKAAFVSQEYDAAIAAYERAASGHGKTVAVADSVTTAHNEKATGEYISKKETRKGMGFWIYALAFLAAFLRLNILSYRAMRYDEKHDEGNLTKIAEAFSAIGETIGQILAGKVWGIKSKLAEWLPETPLHNTPQERIVQMMSEEGCKNVYAYLAQNPSAPEAAIYMAFSQTIDPMSVREYLRALKTLKCAREHGGRWTVDEQEANRFFFDLTTGQVPQKPFQNINNQSSTVTKNNRTFDSEIAQIRRLIDDILAVYQVLDNNQQNEASNIIKDLTTLIETYDIVKGTTV